MKHAPQDAEAILTNTSSPEIAERRRAMACICRQVQPGVDDAWRESRGDIGKGMESVPWGHSMRILLLTIRDIRPLLSEERHKHSDLK